MKPVSMRLTADIVMAPASTNNKTPTVLGWGFFLPDRAGTGGALKEVWCFAINPTTHLPAQCDSDTSLFSI